MTISFLYAVQDSASKMAKNITFPLRSKGSDVSHVAAHAAGDIFQKAREDIIRDEFGDPTESPENRFISWENDLPRKLKFASDSSKFLANFMLARLRDDIAAAGFVLPPAQIFESLSYDEENADVKQVKFDIENYCNKTGVT